MAPKKGDISFDNLGESMMIDVTKDDALPQEDITVGRQLVRLNLNVDRARRREIKEWAVRHDRSILSVLMEGFELMKAKHGA